MNPLARVKRATRRRDSAAEEWRASIRAAAEAGDSLRAIGTAAGISHVRVLQIARGE